MISQNELIVDNFAGGGGASTGIEIGLGRAVDIAINHDPEAVAMHTANHPGTRHYCQSVWKADPRAVVGGRAVGLAWFSPDCKHFSKAKGGKPVEKKIRDLAWVVIRWAATVRPRVIMLENVEEFRDWGPLITIDGGKRVPCPLRKGLTFKRWVRELTRLGYVVEHRELRACDYGAPTIRKRLFLIARRDGQPIVWPVPRHGPGLQPFRTAADCIDWSIPCPSIFGRKKPLAEATQRRIAAGIRRYVIESAQPFVIPITHTGDARVHGLDEPMRTVTTAHRGELALVAPTIVGCGGRAGQSRPRGADEPMATMTAKADSCVVAATMVQTGYGEREGQPPRALDLEKPLGTVVAGGVKHALVAAHVTKFSENSIGSPANEPLHTAMAGAPRHGVVAAFLAQHNGGAVGHEAVEPVSTITHRGTQQQVVTSHLLRYKGTCRDGQVTEKPIGTVEAEGQHWAEVRAFLIKYYGSGGQDAPANEPMHTLTAKARMGLVSVRGVDYQIVDIGMRMLTPRELFRAQGFDDSYIIDPYFGRSRLSKTAQIRMCGNSVCPPIAAALVAANLGDAEQIEAANDDVARDGAA